MSPGAGGHPDLLLWAAGRMKDPDERAEVERHVASCPSCEKEVRALWSMMKSLKTQSRADHIASADLIAWHDGKLTQAGARGQALAQHLAECAECRSDLQLLRRAERVERKEEAAPAAPKRAARRGAGRSLVPLAAAAGLVVLAAIGWGTLEILRGPDAGLRSDRVLFSPSQRSAEDERRLEGRGPWEVRLFLPFGAPAGSYRVWIYGADGTRQSILETESTAGAEGVILLQVPSIPEPGHYVLNLEPRDGGESYLYGFDVTADR